MTYKAGDMVRILVDEPHICPYGTECEIILAEEDRIGTRGRRLYGLSVFGDRKWYYENEFESVKEFENEETNEQETTTCNSRPVVL